MERKDNTSTKAFFPFRKERKGGGVGNLESGIIRLLGRSGGESVGKVGGLYWTGWERGSYC